MRKLNLNKDGFVKRGLNKFKGFSKKKKTLIIVGGLIGLNTVFSFGVMAMNKPKSMAKEEIDGYKNNIEEREKENNKPENIITNNIKGILGKEYMNIEFNVEDKNMNIIFQVPDNLSNKLIIGSGQSKIYDIIKSLQNNEWIKNNIDDISFEGYLDLVDSYGNISNTKVIMSSFEVVTINKINFDNASRDVVFNRFDEAGFIHPALKK